jgi:SAM-dependent methyltransferase
MTFNAPLSEERAATLVAGLRVAPAHHVLDLGCGWAELLLRVVAANPGTTGTGVDIDRADLLRGRRSAVERGLAERVELVEDDVTAFDDRGALVLCVGASHAWGGAGMALAAMRAHVDRGGMLLFGDGFWASPPSERAHKVIGDLEDWAGLVHACEGAGFRVDDADRSTTAEWDAFEQASRAGLESSGLDGAGALTEERRSDYEDGYRGRLGFAWLLLTAVGDGLAGSSGPST